MRVASRLRELRGERSLRTVAAEVGISRGLLSEIERGIRFPPDELVGQLEEVYGAPPSYWYDRPTLLAIQRGGAKPR